MAITQLVVFWIKKRIKQVYSTVHKLIGLWWMELGPSNYRRLVDETLLLWIRTCIAPYTLFWFSLLEYLVHTHVMDHQPSSCTSHWLGHLFVMNVSLSRIFWGKHLRGNVVISFVMLVFYTFFLVPYYATPQVPIGPPTLIIMYSSRWYV